MDYLRLCGGGSVSAVVVRARGERAVFIGSISVWDTIGTLTPRGLEIVALFPPVVRRVMGRKAPRKRLARRVISAFTRVFDARWRAPRVFRRAPERLSALRPPLFAGERSKGANPGRAKRAAGTRWA